MKNYRVKVLFKNGNSMQFDMASDDIGIESTYVKINNVYKNQKPDVLSISGVFINLIETTCVTISEL